MEVRLCNLYEVLSTNLTLVVSTSEVLRSSCAIELITFTQLRSSILNLDPSLSPCYDDGNYVSCYQDL